MGRLPLPRRSVLRLALGAGLAVLVLPFTVGAQRGQAATDSSGGPGYNLPERPTRPLRFTTDEGTWMSLDLSNDGQWVVFDLLGDIYKMPIAGGKATRLTEGQAFDGQPNFSPDGKTIVFASDRSGSENLWLMDADGGHVRALTKETDHSFVSPTWTPDGQYVVASRSNSFSGGLFNVYMYYLGGGTGLQLTGADSATADAGAGGGRGAATALNNFVGPAFGSDPRYLYVAARNGGGGYNQTSLGWQIAVYDRETGHTYLRTDAPGSGMRPELSPDGKWLVYATREDSVTSLRIRDLATGDERWLIHRVQRDDQESRYTRDLEPPFSFTPDSKSIVVAYLGHFWRVSIPDGTSTMIPFSADVDQMIAGAIKDQYPFSDSTFTVHQIRDLAPSPDGKRMAFTALDRVWVMDLPNGTPHRLVASSADGEYSPAWSRDGRSIAYVTWNNLTGGDIYRMSADGSGAPRKLTTLSAYYEKLAYSGDGTRLAFGRGPRDMRRDEDELERPNAQATGVELDWMPASGGAATMIAPLTNFGQPHFGPDTSRVYLSEGGQLVSMRWDGTDIKEIIRIGGGGRGGGGGGGASNILLSPDGSKMLVQSGVLAYLVDAVPMKGGDAPVISTSGPSAVPVHKLTTVGGEFATWTADSKTIYFSLAHTLFAYDLGAAATAITDSTERADSTAAARGGNGEGNGGGRGGAGGGRGGRDGGGAANKPAYEATAHDVVITAARDVPHGTVVLRGARIITMKGNEVVPIGDIVVTNNRIVAVGPRGKVSIPSGARIIDVSGKTIIPGYVDVHAHIWPAFGVHRSQPFEYLVNLAYGVTTARDPQTSSTDVLSYEDMVATGEFIGPRIYSTGPGVFAAEGIKSLADAQLVLSRYSKYYQTNTIKQYMTGDRRVRQFVEMAARDQHLMPTLEGGLDFKKNLTEAMDGYSGSEHTLPIAPLYKDVVQLYATAGITWTPTLIVQYGGPWAENYWYEHSDVIDDPKLNHFTPRDVVERKASRRPGWWDPAQWSFPLFAAQAAKVVAAGGRVGMGSHGQLQGLGAQWEIWNIASGGMPCMDVLRVATIFGAESIGLDQQVGSLEPGKLADLQVLDKNPLDDIKNTNTIKYVMKNGRLYDGNTLNEVWPRTKAAPKLWWWTQNGSEGAGN